jgi:hypothetical protein
LSAESLGILVYPGPGLPVNFVIKGIGKILAAAVISILLELFQLANLGLSPLPLLAAYIALSDDV